MTESKPQNRITGYARVSTYGQTLDAQLEQLRGAGYSSRNIYREKVTGAVGRVERSATRHRGAEIAAGCTRPYACCF